jgi:hypothetical protein
VKALGIGIGIAAILLAGCLSTPNNTTRFTTAVQISEYNSIASRYMYQPTFGTIEHFKGYDVYDLSAERYGTGYLSIRITPENIEYFEQALEKYQKWEEIAVNNEDLIDKGLVEFDSWKLNFYSGNKNTHYFQVQYCSGTCFTMASLDHDNAEKLSIELNKFKKGQLNKTNTEDKYN